MKNLILSVALVIATLTSFAAFAGSEWHNKGYHVDEFVWDFAADGGSDTAAIDLSAKAGSHQIPLHATVHDVSMWVETATAGTGSTYSLGNSASATAYFNAVATATAVKDYVATSSGVPYEVSASNKQDFKLTIGSANATAGKIHVYVGYYY